MWCYRSFQDTLPDTTPIQDVLLLSAPVGFHFRECVGNSRYLVNNRRYCGGGCAAQTKCGPVTIPESHLNVRLFSREALVAVLESCNGRILATVTSKNLIDN